MRGVRPYLVVPLIVVALTGCRFVDFEEREPWRAQAEEQCLAERQIVPSEHMESGTPVNGKGTCGMTKPFHVAAVNGGFVSFKPKATLSCPLVANVEAWFHEAIQPAAMAWYGAPVVEIKQISAYSCRTMNGQPGAAISEHAFGNALDIASFRFADGREVEFKKGWKGRPEERGFLRAIHAAACERFATVLAPGADMFHYDHIHVDLARRASGRGICKPSPMTLPAPAPRVPEVPVARAPSPAPAAQKDYVWQTTPGAQVRSASAGRAPAGVSDSPFAPRSTQPVPAPVQGPAVIAREPAIQRDMRPVGEPLVLLGNHAPPHNSFGAPVPIAERVRQSLGIQQQAAPMRVPPSAVPAPQNPYGLVPPARIPSARTGADPATTGSIPKPEATKAEAKAGSLETGLLSPRSIADEAPSAEAASVFDLISKQKSN